jgi:hypothetical protein
MKQLACKPVFLSLLLCVPLWLILGNFIVAAIVALLISFLISMTYALYALKRAKRDAGDQNPQGDAARSGKR